jgi:hypothetical protein
MLLFEYGWPLLTQKKLALRVMATSNYTLKKKKKGARTILLLKALCATVKKDEPVVLSFIYRYKRLNTQIIHKRTIQAILELNSAVPWLQKVPDFGSKPAPSPHMWCSIFMKSSENCF